MLLLALSLLLSDVRDVGDVDGSGVAVAFEEYICIVVAWYCR